MKKLWLVTASLLLGCVATASGADNGFYFGATGGQARYDFEPLPARAWTTGQIPAPFPQYSEFLAAWTNVPPAPLPSYPPTFPVGIIPGKRQVQWLPVNDDEATTWSALAGYRFLRYAAVEISYLDLGTLEEYVPPRVIGQSTTVDAAAEMQSRGATISMLGQLPITDRWSVYARAGGLFVEQDIHQRVGPTHDRDSYDSEVLLYGIGTQLDLGARWTVRLDFQRYDDVGNGSGILESDVDALSLGVLFRLSGS